MENQVSTPIPAEVSAQIIAKLKEVEALLRPYTVIITDEQKGSFLKMGDKSIPFVNKTLSYVDSAPEFAPSFLNAADFKRDVQMMQAIDHIYQPTAQILHQLEDARALAANGSYSVALLYYNAVKQAAQAGLTKAKTIYEDLGQRFPGRPRKKEEVLKA